MIKTRNNGKIEIWSSKYINRPNIRDIEDRNKKIIQCEGCNDENLNFIVEVIDDEENRNPADVMRIKLDAGAKMPTRAHEDDAGLDLYARDTQIVPARESAIFDTGVHVELPRGTAGFLKSKSGLNVKHGITGEGVIDVGYTGSIVVKLYNNSGIDYKIEAGDKISQLVILPVICPALKVVDELSDTERGNGGFGSTGK